MVIADCMSSATVSRAPGKSCPREITCMCAGIWHMQRGFTVHTVHCTHVSIASYDSWACPLGAVLCTDALSPAQAHCPSSHLAVPCAHPSRDPAGSAHSSPTIYWQLDCILTRPTPIGALTIEELGLFCITFCPL